MLRKLTERNASPRFSLGQILLALGLFLYLYNVNFVFLPLITSRIVLFLGAAVLLPILLKGYRFAFERRALVPVGLCFAFAVYMACSYALQGFSDPSLMKGAALLVLHSSVGALIFSVMLKVRGNDFDGMLQMVQGVVFIQAVFILLYFLSPGYRMFVIDNTVVDGNMGYYVAITRAVQFENFSRARGLAGSFGASLSVMQSLGIMLTAYLLTLEPFKSKYFVYLNLSFLAILASIFMTGRTGLLVLPFAALYFVLLALIERRYVRLALLYFLLVPIAVVGAFFMMKIAVGWFLNGDMQRLTEATLDSVVQYSVLEFLGDGSGPKLTAVHALMQQWMFPPDWSTAIFGDPATWSLHRVSSDIGVIRMLFGSGVVGMMMFYGMFIAMFTVMVASAHTVNRKLFFVVLGFFLLTIELKEPFLSKLSVNPLLFLMFYYLVVSIKTSLVNQSNPVNIDNRLYGE